MIASQVIHSIAQFTSQRFDCKAFNASWFEKRIGSAVHLRLRRSNQSPALAQKVLACATLIAAQRDFLWVRTVRVRIRKPANKSARVIPDLGATFSSVDH